MRPSRRAPLVLLATLASVALAGCTFEPIPKDWTPPRDFSVPPPLPLDVSWTEGPGPVELRAGATRTLTLQLNGTAEVDNRTVRFGLSLRNFTTDEPVPGGDTALRLRVNPTTATLHAETPTRVLVDATVEPPAVGPVLTPGQDYRLRMEVETRTGETIRGIADLRVRVSA